MRIEMIKHFKKILKDKKVYKLFRDFYNFVFLFNSKKSVLVDNVNAIFKTPTFKIREDVLNLLGEKEFIKQLLIKSKNEDVFLDVGASYGLYSILLAKKVRKVIAFEPELKSYRLLQKNINLNNVENLTVFMMALGSYEGKLGLYKSTTANIGTHSFIKRKDYPVSTRETVVEVARGDFLVQQRNICLPSIVKIDVEGYELEVLQGLEQTLKNVRLLQVEIHPKILAEMNIRDIDVKNFIIERGFKIEKISERGTEIVALFERT